MDKDISSSLGYTIKAKACFDGMVLRENLEGKEIAWIREKSETNRGRER